MATVVPNRLYCANLCVRTRMRTKGICGECTMHSTRRVRRRALACLQHLRTLHFVPLLLPPHSLLRSASSRPRDVRELCLAAAVSTYNNECVSQPLPLSSLFSPKGSVVAQSPPTVLCIPGQCLQGYSNTTSACCI